MTEISQDRPSLPSSPDGGYGWVVVAGAFIANGLGFGILYSFTVFFPSILDEFGRGRGGTAWIFSIAAAVLLGSGGVVGRMADRFGPRRMVAVGALLVSAGLLLASRSRSVLEVYLTYGLVLGLGVSCAFLPAVAAVGQWFARRRGLATGLAVAGSGAGTVLIAPISERLIAASDWRGALEVLAVAGLALLLLAAALVRGRGGSMRGGVFRTVGATPTFRILYAGAVLASFGYWVPFVHLVPFATDAGLSTAFGALVVSAMGAANTTGRIVLGAAADHLGRRRIFQISMAAMGLAVLGWPLARPSAALAAFGIVYGFFAGAFISLLPALTGDYFGVARLAGTMGLLNTGAALGTLLGAPTAGLLFDLSGSYLLGILLSALFLLAGAAILFRLPEPSLS